jgi:hypothetical protein
MLGSAGPDPLGDAAQIGELIGALVATVAIWQSARSVLGRTVLSRHDTRRKLNQMACGVAAEYVTGLFGPAAFRRALPEVPGHPADITELIYRTRHAWLQVLLRNTDAAVASFSVTVTDPRFRYRTRHLTNEQIDLRLGSARFSDLRHDPDGWVSRTGARRFAYAESHWFGNPGNYQPFVLSYNDAGAGHYEIPHHGGPVEHSGGRLRAENDYRPAPFEPLPSWLEPARGQTTVNTLTVIGAGAPRCLVRIAGVNADEVRTLRDSRTARRNRARLRRIQRDLRRKADNPGSEAEQIPAGPGEGPGAT